MFKSMSAEKFVERLNVDVYPITVVKFLLNKRKILYYFSKAADKNFEIRGVKYQVDNSTCDPCNSKDDGVLCRQHTSIQRVVDSERVAFDVDTNCYFFKNEIFRKVGGRMVIVYCPHPKLIAGDITDEKVRKVNPITIEDEVMEIPEYNEVNRFISSDLLDQHVKCWFNDEFSIVTVPDDRNSSNWCLISNK